MDFHLKLSRYIGPKSPAVGSSNQQTNIVFLALAEVSHHSTKVSRQMEFFCKPGLRCPVRGRICSKLLEINLMKNEPRGQGGRPPTFGQPKTNFWAVTGESLSRIIDFHLGSYKLASKRSYKHGCVRDFELLNHPPPHFCSPNASDSDRCGVKRVVPPSTERAPLCF